MGKVDNRRQVYLALVADVESQLRDAYAERNEQGQETQSSLAEKLGVNRSVVNRRLRGLNNLTLETLADMVWGLGQCIKVDIFDPETRPSNHVRVVSEHAKPSTMQISHSDRIKFIDHPSAPVTRTTKSFELDG